MERAVEPEVVHPRERPVEVRLAQQVEQLVAQARGRQVADEPHIPFGGTGASGNGTRIGGPANWEEFTNWQWVTIKDKPNPYPF
jgi:acyl-CoA reductase-like NAD-dependent aldehyde dehydrogenase